MLLDEQGKPVAEPSQVTNGTQSDASQPPTGAAPTPPVAGDDTEAGRYQYWQKQAEEWRNRAEERELYAPVVEYLKRNPQVIDKLEEELSTGRADVAAAPQGANKPLAKPARPAKPINYDPVEAQTDPKSASFKYRQDMEEYQEGLVAYMEAQENRRAQEERQYYEQMQRQQMFREKMNETYNTLTTAYKFAPEEANDFIQKMTRKESLTLDNLVALYRIQKQRGPAQPGAQTKSPTRSEIPLPAAVAGGEAPPAGSDPNTEMSEAMREYMRRTRWGGSPVAR